MTVLRNAALDAAHDTSRAVLEILDGAGFTVRSIALSERKLTIQLDHGTARAAITALCLPFERASNFSGETYSPGPFSVADCTLVAIPITVYGDYDPQVHDDDERGAAFDAEFGAMDRLTKEAVVTEFDAMGALGEDEDEVVDEVDDGRVPTSLEYAMGVFSDAERLRAEEDYFFDPELCGWRRREQVGDGDADAVARCETEPEDCGAA